MMKYPRKNCYDLIKGFEGCSLEAYADPIGIQTIGWGTIRYPGGSKVQPGDKITQEQAEEYLVFEVEKKTKGIHDLLNTDTLNQNQFDALVSFAYNCGLGALKQSTLLKMVKVNPAEYMIRDEFMKWNKAGGQILKGLTRRRKAEADLYFT